MICLLEAFGGCGLKSLYFCVARTKSARSSQSCRTVMALTMPHKLSSRKQMVCCWMCFSPALSNRSITNKRGMESVMRFGVHGVVSRLDRGYLLPAYPLLLTRDRPRRDTLLNTCLPWPSTEEKKMPQGAQSTQGTSWSASQPFGLAMPQAPFGVDSA